MFRYWLQGGRITVGFLGGAQIDVGLRHVGRESDLGASLVGAGAQRVRAGACDRRSKATEQRHFP